MELRELTYFVTVCTLHNFTAAAEALHVSQPAVSKAVTRLEAELGLSLLDRSQKRVQLTAEGKIFLELAKGFLDHFQSLQNTMAEYKKLSHDTFRLAVPPLLGAYVFPALFAAFKKSYPALDMLVVDDGSAAAVNLVLEKNVHAALVMFPDNLAALPLCSHQITTQEITVCLPPHHRLAAKPTLSFTDINKEPLILYNEGYLLRKIILDNYAQAGLAPNITISTNQFQTIKALVAQDVGISFLPVDCISQEDSLISRSLVPALYLTMGLIWLPDTSLPLAGKTFIDFTRRYTHASDKKNAL
ncbi:MAG: LysR family transcriptional regulator [Sporomusaceae bacterium]|nr:LysR family transcriptional regulator [Sporomusaceae bacterium]